MSDPYFGCPYCGNEYGTKTACCGEAYTHGVWITPDGKEWPTEEAASKHEQEVACHPQRSA